MAKVEKFRKKEKKNEFIVKEFKAKYIYLISQKFFSEISFRISIRESQEFLEITFITGDLPIRELHEITQRSLNMDLSHYSRSEPP